MAISDDGQRKEFDPEPMGSGIGALSGVPRLQVEMLLRKVLFKAAPQIEETPLKTLTILLPALDEEEGIGDVIESIPTKEIRAAGCRTTVMVVDGHSKDLTRRIAEEKGAKILLQRGKGKGSAVRTGLEMSDSDFLIMMDADNSYPAEAIPTFLEYLESGSDVVMGSRLTGCIEDGAMSNLNRAGNKILSFIATALYGRKTTDVCTGMWGFSRRAIGALELNSTGFEIESEIFAKAVKGNLSIQEVPIRYSRRKGIAKLGSLDCGVKIALKLLRKKFIP